MSTLPTKKQVQELFPSYRVSIAGCEIEVAVDRLTLQRVDALVVKRIVSKTEKQFSLKRDTAKMVELDIYTDGINMLKEAGLNVFISPAGLAIIPSDVVRTRF